MECSECREAISARFDGEATVSESLEIDVHLAGCAHCRDWQDAARAITRRVRLQPALDVPDLVDQILIASPAPTPVRWYRRAGTRRIALGTVAVGQILLGVLQIFGALPGHPHSTMAGMEGMTNHVANESSTWNLAIGFGMLFAAARPRAALGMLPVLGPFVVVITILSARDLASGEVTVSRLATHGLLLVGLGLLIAIQVAERRDPGPRHSSRVRANHPTATSGEGWESEPGGSTQSPNSSRHLRPASRRAA